MLYGVLPLWLFSWFTTWNILSSRSILPIPRLAECIGSGGLQRRLYPVCRKGLRDFRPPVRIHVLHSKRQPEAAGRGLRLSFPVAAGAAGRVRNPERGFFPAGDVLLLFVIAGLVLFFTRNWGDGAILAAAVVFLLQPVEWYHCIAGLLNPAHRLPDLGVGEMYARVAEYTKAGNFGDFILGNVTLGQKASLLWAVNAGRFVQTAGLFLLGFYIGRKQLFVATEKNLRFWVKTLIVSAIAFAPLYTLRELVMDNGAVVGQTAGTALDMWQKLAFTLVLVASFILLYQRRKFSAAVAGLRFYGRMSLTNYISQSVIGAFVYFPFGLYLAPRCGYTASLLVGILVFLLQVRFCKWWLGRHKQGPLEYIWHKWTWIGTDK